MPDLLPKFCKWFNGQMYDVVIILNKRLQTIYNCYKSVPQKVTVQKYSTKGNRKVWTLRLSWRIKETYRMLKYISLEKDMLKIQPYNEKGAGIKIRKRR